MNSVEEYKEMLFRNFASLYVFSQMFGLVDAANFTYLFECLDALPELKEILEKEWGISKVTNISNNNNYKNAYSASVSTMKKPVSTDTLSRFISLETY